MSNSRIALRWPYLAAVALACTPVTERERPNEPAASPAPPTIELASLPVAIRPEPTPIASDQVVFVEQLEIPEPQSWRFEPGGDRIAAPLDGECGIWAIGAGDFLGFTPEGPEAPEDPCKTWPGLTSFGFRSPQSSSPTTFVQGDAKLVLDRGRASLSGPHELRARARQGERYRDAAFSPDQRELALLVGGDHGPFDVEIWNLESGRKVRELSLEADEFDATLIACGVEWGPHALVAALEWELAPQLHLPDEDGYVYEESGVDWPEQWIGAKVWSTSDAEPIPIYFPDPEFPGMDDWSENLFVDPEQRWLIADVGEVVSRAHSKNRIDVEPIGGAGPFNLDWEYGGDSPEREPDASLDPPTRRWTDVVGSSFVETMGYAYHDSAHSPDFDLRWRTMSLVDKPLPDRGVELGFTRGSVLEGDMVHHEWRLLLAGGGHFFADRDLCIYEDEPCDRIRVAPEGCEIIDAAWDFERLLLDCDDRWMLAATPESQTAIDPATLRELARGSEGPRALVWGPSALAIWTASTGLRVFVGERLVASHAQVELVRARLDESLDLGLIRADEGLRVLDLVDRTLGPTLTWTGPVEHAAFAPDRRHFAVAGGGELALFERGQAWPVLRWQSGSIAGLGFRQDGAVLYVGVERALPELALDPVDGHLVESAQLDRVALERIAAAQLDPSWRWAVAEDGTMLRTIDGQALDLRGRSESGWFEGDPARHDEVRLRLGPDPLSPVYDLEVFADQLRRPNLIDEFFAGDPLPRPTLQRP